MESVKSINIVEDSSVDLGGCIIETDFGEIDARIASQLMELENKILEISPIGSRVKENTPPPIVRTSNLNSELLASSALADAMTSMEKKREEAGETEDETEEDELSAGASAALTASAALAALATMATKGKRASDKKLTDPLEKMAMKK